MGRHALGGGRGEAGGSAGIGLGSGNRNQLKRAEAPFPHTMGSLEVTLKASPAFMGSWLPTSLQSAVLCGSFGPHVWSPCGRALAAHLLLSVPVPSRKRRRAKGLCQLSPCPSTCSNFHPLLSDQNGVSIIGLTLAAREAGKLDISSQAHCRPR